MSKNTNYRLLGRTESPYTMKVRSALRYKDLNYAWLDRFRYDRLFRRHARVPLIPMLFLPDGRSLQDSTPILDYLEAEHPEPSLHPTDPALRFLSELLEEYGDEWGNKLMFHYRWTYPADQQRRGTSLAHGLLAGKHLGWTAPLLGPLVRRAVIKRMVPRMAFAGANDNNAPILIDSMMQLIDMLEAHLAQRPYLFGARPAYGDFGLWAQLHQAWSDPSCEALFNQRAPQTVAWIQRMLQPQARGEFESLEALLPTLEPILSAEVGSRFLAWSDANARAHAAGQARTELSMDGRVYWQKTFKYPASTLQALRQKFRAAMPNPTLQAVLERSGCVGYLEADDDSA